MYCVLHRLGTIQIFMRISRLGLYIFVALFSWTRRVPVSSIVSSGRIVFRLYLVFCSTCGRGIVFLFTRLLLVVAISGCLLSVLGWMSARAIHCFSAFFIAAHSRRSCERPFLSRLERFIRKSHFIFLTVKSKRMIPRKFFGQVSVIWPHTCMSLSTCMYLSVHETCVNFSVTIFGYFLVFVSLVLCWTHLRCCVARTKKDSHWQHKEVQLERCALLIEIVRFLTHLVEFRWNLMRSWKCQPKWRFVSHFYFTIASFSVGNGRCFPLLFWGNNSVSRMLAFVWDWGVGSPPDQNPWSVPMTAKP